MRRLALFIVAALAVAACSIAEDSSPRNIPVEQTANFGQSATGGEAEGELSIYLLAPVGTDDQTQLRSVRRNTLSTPTDVLRELLNGPNVIETAAGLSSALPPGLVIRDARTVGTRLTVDLNDALNDLSDRGLRDALAQIVATASELEQVQQIRLRVDGENRSWPTGDGEVTDRPLTIFDFPGFLETSQPPFAALPST